MLLFFSQGFSEFLPQLVDQMASVSLEPDTKNQLISYEVVRDEDTEQVLKLLRNTFFKVCEISKIFFSHFILAKGSISFFLPSLFSLQTFDKEEEGEMGKNVDFSSVSNRL